MSDLIGLVGLKQHGKDTTADLLVKNYGFTKRAYADRLKEIVMREFDLSWEQVYGVQKEVSCNWHDENGKGRTPRFILQWLGSEGFRTIDPNFWVKSLFKNLPSDEKTVICDVRFPNEIEAITKRGGKIWVVDMPNKPVQGSFWSNLLDRVFRRGAYHQSETMARKMVTAARNGKLDPKMIYVPFTYGDIEDNEATMYKAWGQYTLKNTQSFELFED